MERMENVGTITIWYSVVCEKVCHWLKNKQILKSDKKMNKRLIDLSTFNIVFLLTLYHTIPNFNVTEIDFI